MNVIQLLNLAYMKIEIEFEDGILKNIIEKDKKFLAQIKDPDQSQNLNEEHIIIEMIMKDYTQIVQLMILFGAKLNIKSKKPVKL